MSLLSVFKKFRIKSIIPKEDLSDYDDILYQFKDSLMASDIVNIQNRLSKKFNKEPKINDVKFAILNQLVRLYSAKNDFQGLSSVYFNMTLIVRQERKNPIGYLQSFHEMQLRNWQSTGLVKTIKIYTGKDNMVCGECQKLDEKIYTIDQALKEKPLPCKECWAWHEVAKDEDGKEIIKKFAGPGCRCYYRPEDISL